VKKIIRKRDQPEYLRAEGTWTRDISEALVIEAIQDAITAVTVHQLQAVELLYLQDDQPGQYDFAVPLSDAPEGSDFNSLPSV